MRNISLDGDEGDLLRSRTQLVAEDGRCNSLPAATAGPPAGSAPMKAHAIGVKYLKLQTAYAHEKSEPDVASDCVGRVGVALIEAGISCSSFGS